MIAYALDSLPKNGEERQFFKHFSSQTVSQLSGVFGSTFWERHVLQASLHEPAIWHATIALGAAHHKIGCKSGCETIRVPENFAVRQYMKAISCLTKPNNHGKQLNRNAALICCVLFICFEVRYLRIRTSWVIF